MATIASNPLISSTAPKIESEEERAARVAKEEAAKGVSSGSSSPSAAVPVAQQQGPSASGRFTNLKGYMAANTNTGDTASKIASGIAKQRESTQGQLSAASSKVGAAIQAERAQTGGAESLAGSAIQGLLNKLGSGQTLSGDEQKQLETSVGATYHSAPVTEAFAGLQGLAGNVNQLEQQASNLGSQSGRYQLLKSALGGQGYTRGQGALDASLLGADTGANALLNTEANLSKDVVGSAGTEEEKRIAENKAAQEAITKARANLIGDTTTPGGALATTQKTLTEAGATELAKRQGESKMLSNIMDTINNSANPLSPEMMNWLINKKVGATAPGAEKIRAKRDLEKAMSDARKEAGAGGGVAANLMGLSAADAGTVESSMSTGQRSAYNALANIMRGAGQTASDIGGEATSFSAAPTITTKITDKARKAAIGEAAAQKLNADRKLAEASYKRDQNTYDAAKAAEVARSLGTGANPYSESANTSNIFNTLFNPAELTAQTYNALDSAFSGDLTSKGKHHIETTSEKDKREYDAKKKALEAQYDTTHNIPTYADYTGKKYIKRDEEWSKNKGAPQPKTGLFQKKKK